MWPDGERACLTASKPLHRIRLDQASVQNPLEPITQPNPTPFAWVRGKVIGGMIKKVVQSRRSSLASQTLPERTMHILLQKTHLAE